jgi:hypothetical protein
MVNENCFTWNMNLKNLPYIGRGSGLENLIQPAGSRADPESR